MTTRTPSKIRSPVIGALGLVAHFEGGNEGGLGNLHLAELAHALLALFLLLEQLALAADVAAIALGEHVLPERLHGLARDDTAADRGLDRDLEKLARDQVLQALAEGAAAPVGLGAVHDERERVHRLAVHEDGHRAE